MNEPALTETAGLLLSGGRGLLAMDESTSTCDRRLTAAGVQANLETRHAWRELLVTAPGLGESIGAAILYDETIRQSTSDGRRFIDVLTQAGHRGHQRDGRHTGRTDLALSPHGEEQASRLAPWLADTRFALVRCSPMVRYGGRGRPARLPACARHP